MQILKSLAILIIFVVTSLSVSRTLNAAYKFPWPQGYEWSWTQGWHYNGYNYAIDIGTTEGNKPLLAAEDGVVNYVCDDGRSVYVNIDQVDKSRIGYFHIESGKKESNIVAGRSISRGQLLGQLKSGNMPTPDPGCGVAFQSASFGHIHWTFPGGAGRNIEGWLLSNYPTSTMTNGSQVKRPGNTISSTNQYLLRNNVINGSKIYETKNNIRISGDENGFILAPSGSNTVIIRVL